MPHAGDVVHVGPACSVQFRHGCDLAMRVISWETSPSTPYGWIHLTGYQLDENGLALTQRTVLVQTSGLRLMPAPPPLPPRTRPVNRGSMTIPRLRTSRPARSTLR